MVRTRFNDWTEVQVGKWMAIRSVVRGQNHRTGFQHTNHEFEIDVGKLLDSRCRKFARELSPSIVIFKRFL